MYRTKIEKNIDRKGSWFDSICCQVDNCTTKNGSVMAAEFLLLPKQKYEQLEKDATPKDGNLSTPSDDPTDNNDNQSDLPHNNELGPNNYNTNDGNDDYDVSDVLESFNSTKLKYVHTIITLMENNKDVLTWKRKTGEILFLQQLVHFPFQAPISHF